MTNYDHVLPDLRHAFDLTDRKRMKLTEQPVWIPYPAAESILGRLEWLLELPKQDRIPCLLIIGEPNSGKTTIVKKFCQMHGKGRVDENNDPVRPVILAPAPPSASQKSLYVSLLDRFQAPYRTTASSMDLCLQTIKLIDGCHTRMLILDEFHSLLAGGGKKLAEVLNAVRHLCNELQIPIIGVGTAQALTVFTYDSQLTSRFGVVELEAWKLGREFQRLLIAFEQALPLKKPSDLRQPDLARLLHLHSGGNLGDLRRLLIECAKAAIVSGAERIDKALIESTAKSNPWRRDSGTWEREA